MDNSQNSIKVDQEIPLEYQVFALAFKQAGAISYFKEFLDEEYMGRIHGDLGINEFYLALIHFHETTGLDTVDVTAFRSWLLSETDIYEALGGQTGVSVMLDYVLGIEPAAADAVVELIKYKGNKRKQINYLQELQILLNKKGHKDDEDKQKVAILTSAIKDLQNAIHSNPLDKVSTGEDLAHRAESLLDIPSFIPTQYRSLNKAMGYSDDGGFFRGAVHAVIGASGVGKSTFTKCLANHWLDSGYRVLYINFEEAIGHWERILMTQIIEKNVYLEARSWTKVEREKYLKQFREKLNQWGDNLLVRHDPDTPYFEDLEIWLKDIVTSGEKVPDIVIIDTIQSMFTRSKGKARWGEFEEMMVKLEKLAKEMNCALIITAQENSNRMKEKREVVMQSDTGGSLAIQQKCAVTIFITQKKLASQDESEDDRIMQLQMPKNRITGTTYMYDPPLVKYIDEYKKYVEYDAVEDYDYRDETALYSLLDGKGFD
jgi:replicative DNA helicase